MFFFKQKTAYEMRISDWSSDVCSSDLRVEPFHIARPRARPVRLAKIGRKRPPVSRLDPPLRLLPIMPIIVGEALVIGRGHPRRGQAFGEREVRAHLAVGDDAVEIENDRGEIGRASCRERVCQYV